MPMEVSEVPLTFSCDENLLVGIVHMPEQCKRNGVVIVVGGPQYRVGSHRQFLLLARFLAANGIPVMRFDYRGMGDSSGDLCTFEHVNDDVTMAIDIFFEQCPKLESVCVWGLCDAASAALFYAHQDRRVSSLVLLNPWIRTDAGEAKAYLKHYYFSRLTSKDFWKKVFSGNFRATASLRSVSKLTKAARDVDGTSNALSLPEKMLFGLKQFSGSVLIILSGKDLTASEFRDLISSNQDWERVLKKKQVVIKELPEANHTFSTAELRSDVENITLNWLLKIK